MTTTSIVIPNWNGMRWLDGVLDSIKAQTMQPSEIIVVDNGSTDGSREHLEAAWPEVDVVHWHENRGFAAAANDGFHRAQGEFVALINTDIELAVDWLERSVKALESAGTAASVATKMVDLEDPAIIYDTGNFLRRDGACEQRGRFKLDEGQFDQPGEVWSACAGAALYRKAAVVDVGGFEERFFTYLEDVELGLRLRMAGWTSIYEPCVARHAGGGSEAALTGGAAKWVERNTVLLVVRHFPLRWAGPVLYRQIAWKVNALKAGSLGPFMRGLITGLRWAPSMLKSRRESPASVVPIEVAVPDRPWRGPTAGGHPLSPE